MKKIIIIIFISIITGCNKNKSESLNSTNLNQTNEAIFNEDKHLFLNFYEGMSRMEYSNAILENMRIRKIFPGMNEDNIIDVNKHIFFELISGKEYINFKSLAYFDSIDFNTEIKPQNDFVSPYNTPFLYNLSINGDDLYTQLNPLFDEKGKLFAISLNVNLYNASWLEGQKLANKMLELKNMIVKLYSSKYGKPKIKKERKNDFGYGIAGKGYFRLWDQNSYTYFVGFKTIVINQIIEEEPSIPFYSRTGTILSTNCTYYLTDSKNNQENNQENIEMAEKMKATKDSIELENLNQIIKKQKNKSTLDDI